MSDFDLFWYKSVSEEGEEGVSAFVSDYIKLMMEEAHSLPPGGPGSGPIGCDLLPEGDSRVSAQHSEDTDLSGTGSVFQLSGQALWPDKQPRKGDVHSETDTELNHDEYPVNTGPVQVHEADPKGDGSLDFSGLLADSSADEGL